MAAGLHCAVFDWPSGRVAENAKNRARAPEKGGVPLSFERERHAALSCIPNTGIPVVFRSIFRSRNTPPSLPAAHNSTSLPFRTFNALFGS